MSVYGRRRPKQSPFWVPRLKQTDRVELVRALKRRAWDVLEGDTL